MSEEKKVTQSRWELDPAGPPQEFVGRHRSADLPEPTTHEATVGNVKGTPKRTAKLVEHNGECCVSPMEGVVVRPGLRVGDLINFAGASFRISHTNVGKNRLTLELVDFIPIKEKKSTEVKG